MSPDFDIKDYLDAKFDGVGKQLDGITVCQQAHTEALAAHERTLNDHDGIIRIGKWAGTIVGGAFLLSIANSLLHIVK